jgi:hypothetical protein
MPSIATRVRDNNVRIAQYGAAAHTPVVPLLSASSPIPPPNSNWLPSRGSYPPGVILDSDFSDAVGFPPSSLRSSTLLTPGNNLVTYSSPSAAVAAAQANKVVSGSPQQVTSFSAAEASVSSRAQITATWSAQPNDTNYSFAQIWVTGYHGSKNAQLVASGKSSLVFTLDPTGEQVTLYAVAVSAAGVSVSLSGAPSATVVLH